MKSALADPDFPDVRLRLTKPRPCVKVYPCSTGPPDTLETRSDRPKANRPRYQTPSCSVHWRNWLPRATLSRSSFGRSSQPRLPTGRDFLPPTFLQRRAFGGSRLEKVPARSSTSPIT